MKEDGEGTVCLDSLGKEISSLRRIFGEDKGGAKLRHNIGTRVDGLADKSKGTKHGKTAVLDLLKLLLGILLGGVVEAKGVPCSGIPNANIANDAVLALLLDAGDTTVFHPSHTGNNLVEGRFGHSGQGLEGVEFTVGIDSAKLLGSGEGTKETGPDESNHGELGNTAVCELGLTEPLQVSHEVALNVQWVVE